MAPQIRNCIIGSFLIGKLQTCFFLPFCIASMMLSKLARKGRRVPIKSELPRGNNLATVGHIVFLWSFLSEIRNLKSYPLREYFELKSNELFCTLCCALE